MTDTLLLLSLLLDDSGSMTSIKEGMISGFNEFVNSQRNSAGRMLFTLCKFHNPGAFNIVQKMVEPDQIQLLHADTYNPNGGSTALYDGIDSFLDLVDEIYAIADLQNPDTDVDVINVILTDGGNNAGNTTKQAAFARLKAVQDDKQWNVVYLGANQDAYAVGAGIGAQAGSTRTFAASSKGVADTYGGLSNSVSTYRASRVAGQSVSYNANLLQGMPKVVGDEEDSA